MFEICEENSSLSGMGYRRCVFFPGARFQNLFDLREDDVTLSLAIVKVWRNAHARLGPVVYKDLPRKEFAAHLEGMGALDGNSSCALRGIFRSVDAPAARLCAFDQSRGHSNRFFADRGNTNFIENIQTGSASVERRNVRRAVQIAKGVFARVYRPGFECKWPLVRDPSGQRGPQFRAQIFADVEVGNARPATEPLQNSAHRKISTQASDVERNGSGRLKRIEDDVGADAVGPLDDRARINDKRAA